MRRGVWSACSKTHNDVAKYLLNAAELLLDNESTLRYATDKAWYVDFHCFSWIIYNVTETPHMVYKYLRTNRVNCIHIRASINQQVGGLNIAYTSCMV